MLTVLKSRNFWVFTALTALFFLIAPWFPRTYVFDVVNAFSIATAIGVIVMYYPSVAKNSGSWFWVFWNNLSGAHYFVIGILGFCIYIISRHTYQAFWRWYGKPDWMVDHLFLAYLVFLPAMIATMHLLSRDIQEGAIPRANWRWVGIFTAIGIALAGLSIAILDPSPAVVGMTKK